MSFRLKNPILFLCALLLVATAAYAAEDEEPKRPTTNINEQGPTYVNISPFVVPVLGVNGPEEMVSLIVTLEVSSQEKADYVRARLPRLNDAFMQTLYGSLDRGTIKRNGLINVTLMKDKLMKAAADTLGLGFVNDVLVQALAERRLKITTESNSSADEKPH